jgi:hypothetical protein
LHRFARRGLKRSEEPSESLANEMMVELDMAQPDAGGYFLNDVT